MAAIKEEPTYTSEAAREREVFKYYQPASSKTPNLAHALRSSNDSALQSFAQCAALRLNARTCIISLFTKKFQYIIAEATRTLSSQNDEVHGESDQLWRGVGAIPRKTGPCIQAFSFFCSPERPEFLIFHDLSGDNVYSKLPYVSGPPGMRFFAAVPIISPSEIVIGSFAVFDTSSRDSIDIADLHFMRDISTTTTQHLEICRAQQNNYRAERMIKGLGYFIEGKASIREWWLVTGHKGEIRKVNKGLRGGKTLEQLADDEFGHQDAHGAPKSDQIITLRTKTVGDTRSTIPQEANDSASQTPSLTPSRTPTSVRSSYLDPKSATLATFDTAFPSINRLPQNPSSTQERETGEDPPTPNMRPIEYPDTPSLPKSRSRRVQSISGGARLQNVVLIKDTFSKASNLIRESMLVEGCLFLDANIGNFGGFGIGTPPNPPSAWRASKSPVVTSSDEEAWDTKRNPDNVEVQDASKASKTFPNTEDVPADQEVYKKSKAFSDLKNTFDNQEAPITPPNSSTAKFCGILGYSTSSRSSLNMHEALDLHLTVLESLLRSLLKRYPHGKVFNFDEDGNALVNEEESHLKARDPIQNVEGRTPTEDEAELERQKRKMKTEMEAREISNMLPRARSVAFFSLWDPPGERWFAGCLVWSVENSRILDDEDLVYLAVFGNSIMAEVSRLNALVAVK